MRSLPARRCLAIETVAIGIAYGAGLCWVSTALVGSFRPGNLSTPYWSGIPILRTDTCGIVAFFAAGGCFAVSEYLRLLRHQDMRNDHDLSPALGRKPPSGNLALLALTAAETVALLATGLVIYISVNAVTHPATLEIQATHLVAWPTEGTLRVDALVMCACSVGALRYLLASKTAALRGELKRRTSDSGDPESAPS